MAAHVVPAAPRSVHWYLVEAIRGNVIVVSADKR
jgi:hypothetical protein